MLESFLSKVPASWDVDFILAQLAAAEVTNHYGHNLEVDEETGDETGLRCWRVLNDDADKLLAIVDGYQTDYLAVLIPRLKAHVKAKRTQRREEFSFQGTPLPLDEVTMGRLGNMALGLQLCPEVEDIYWDKGVLDFLRLPRELAIPLAKAAFKFVQSDFTFTVTLGELLDAAETVDAALAIDLESGWPEVGP